MGAVADGDPAVAGDLTGLLSVQRSPSSLPVLLTPTTWCVRASMTGEPDVPWIVSHCGVYRIESFHVQPASRSRYTVASILQP